MFAQSVTLDMSKTGQYPNVLEFSNMNRVLVAFGAYMHGAVHVVPQVRPFPIAKVSYKLVASGMYKYAPSQSPAKLLNMYCTLVTPSRFPPSILPLNNREDPPYGLSNVPDQSVEFL
jgi:hypothetical protein